MTFNKNCMCISEEKLWEAYKYLSSIKDENYDNIVTAMCCIMKEICRIRDLDVIIVPKYYFKDLDVKQECIKLEREPKYNIKEENLTFFPPIIPCELRKNTSFKEWVNKGTKNSWWNVGFSKGNI